MKKNTSLLFSLAAAILPALPANALVEESIVTLNGSVTYQDIFRFADAAGGGGDIERTELETVRISTKDLLKAIAFDEGFILPKKSRFLFIDDEMAKTKGVDGGMWIIDRDGFLISNVSSYFDLFFDSENEIYGGFYNYSNGKQGGTALLPFSVFLDFALYDGRAVQNRGLGPELIVEVSGQGILVEKYKGTPRRDFYTYTSKSSGATNLFGIAGSNIVRGEGELNAMGAVTVRVSGKEFYSNL